MQIREARIEDAADACHTLRRSIAELCGLDHGGDPDVLERRLANKTPKTLAAWIANPANRVLVTEEDGAILAVGAVTAAGEITLNYVSPDARFRGVSSALLRRLERGARALGNTACSLTSSQTAHRFYLARGYVDAGEIPGKFGTARSFVMTKQLAHED